MRLPHPHDRGGHPCPADPSSPIPAALAPSPRRPAPVGRGAHPARLPGTIPDPRRGAGRRHPLAAIAEWAADTPQAVQAALGARRADPGTWVVPAEATFRRTLARVDPVALAGVLGAWLAARDRPGPGPGRCPGRAVAVDGKTLRGARRAGDGRQVHLLACMDHATRTVLAQRAVDGAPARCPPSSRGWPAWTLPGWS